MEWSGNGAKQTKNMQKIFRNLFGSVRPEFEPHFSEISKTSWDAKADGVLSLAGNWSKNRR